MNPDVSHDPIFQQLVIQHEVASRKLREAVAAMRSFFLNHHKSPDDENKTEKWRGAALSEEASALFQRVEESAAQLLRYSYEIAPMNSSPEHMEELERLRSAHRERLKRGGGWSGERKTIRGIEEKVHIDDGAPITVIIKPSAYSFTDRSRRRKPATNGVDDSSGRKQVVDEDDDVHRAPPKK